MQISLPLDKMSIQEKISTMETLWRDLSQNPDAYDSSLWHREVLECREAEGGEFTNWEDAKREIREQQSVKHDIEISIKELDEEEGLPLTQIMEGIRSKYE